MISGVTSDFLLSKSSPPLSLEEDVLESSKNSLPTWPFCALPCLFPLPSFPFPPFHSSLSPSRLQDSLPSSESSELILCLLLFVLLTRGPSLFDRDFLCVPFRKESYIRKIYKIIYIFVQYHSRSLYKLVRGPLPPFGFLIRTAGSRRSCQQSCSIVGYRVFLSYRRKPLYCRGYGIQVICHRQNLTHNFHLPNFEKYPHWALEAW